VTVEMPLCLICLFGTGGPMRFTLSKPDGVFIGLHLGGLARNTFPSGAEIDYFGHGHSLTTTTRIEKVGQEGPQL
jgi:hypothetical protein